MESPELRKVSHIGLWILVLSIGGWLVWQATHTNIENNRYGSGTIPITQEEHNYGLVNLKPCGAFFSFDGQKKEQVKK